MGDILTLASKIERAMRNDTGFNVTREEREAIVSDDILEAIYAAKLRRLKARCPAKPANTLSETTGSTNAATANPPTSGKSQPISGEAAKSYIAALGFGT